MPILTDLTLARGSVDFAGDHRADQAWLDAVWADGNARVLLLCGDATLVSAAHDGVVWLPPDRLAGITDGADATFLGVAADGTARFSVNLAADSVTALVDADRQRGQQRSPTVTGRPADAELGSLRDVGGLIGDDDASWFVPAVALARWHESHPCCARCGAWTEVAQAGHTRVCPSCQTEHFPRTDPAIIVLVTDEQDRALLGHGAAWPPGRYSTLAGFVEPGETIEAAVVREVAEETGVVVTDPVYAGSQPWPFPASLMLGFLAHAARTDIVTDDVEVSAARWYTRAELRAEVEAGEVLLPSGISISHRLVQHWYGGPLPTGPQSW